MVPFKENPAFVVWSVTVTLLVLKCLATSLLQAFVRVRNRRYVRPDDARFFGRDAEPAEEEHILVQRGAGVWRNDLENIPFFFFLSLAMVLAGADVEWTLACCGIFVLARVSHSAFYFVPRQPFRNIAYQLGMLTMLVVAGKTLWLLLS